MSQGKFLDLEMLRLGRLTVGGVVVVCLIVL